MRLKNTSLLAAIGTIFTILPIVLNFFVPYSRTFFISSTIMTIGSILLIIFFYLFTIRQQETTYLRTAGVLGLIGYLIIIILNLLDTISNIVSNMAVEYPLKYTGLVNIVSRLSRVNLLIELIPIVLILICFMIFYKNLNKEGHLKKVALLVFIGQLILLIEWIMNLIMNMPFFKILYQRISPKDLSIISTLESIIGLIPSILLAIFFVVLYRELDNNENKQQFA